MRFNKVAGHRRGSGHTKRRIMPKKRIKNAEKIYLGKSKHS